MYAQLGDIIFEALIGFDSYQRTREVVYAQHDLMDRQAKIQPTAIGLQKIAVGIAFHDDFCIPEDEIAKIEGYALDFEVLPLLFGNGRYIGDFVVTDLSEQVIQTYPDGTYQEARLTFNLLEVASSERDNRAAIKKQQEASALQSNKPNTIRGQPRSYQTPEGQLTTSTVFAMAESRNADSLLHKMLVEGGFSDRWATVIEESLEKAQKYLGVASDVLAGNPSSLLLLAPTMPFEIGTALNSIANFQSSILLSDVNGMVGANGSLQRNMDKVKLAAKNIDLKTILRL